MSFPEKARHLVLATALLLTLAGLSTASAFGQPPENSSPAQDQHLVLYVAGLRAFDLEKWQEALMLFDAARQLQPREGGWVRVYGMRYEPYLPHIHLGICLFRLDKLEQAQSAWSESERQGVVLQRPSRKWRRQVSRLREEIAGRLERLTQDLQEDLQAALQEIDTNRRELAEEIAEDGQLAAEMRELRQLGDQARQALEALKQRPEAGRHRRADELVDALWDRLDEWLAGRDEQLRIIRQRRLERQAIERRERLQRQISEARERLQSGGCDRQAIQLLLDFLRDWDREESLAPSPTPFLDLARARLQCAELRAATRRLDQAREAGLATAERLSQVADQLSRAAERAEVRRRYRRAADLVARGACHREAILELEGLLARPTVESALSDSDSPHLLLARAYLACGALQTAADSLHRAGERAPEAPEVLEVRRALEREQRSARRRAEHQRRAIRAAEELSSGDCRRDALGALEGLLLESEAPLADDSLLLPALVEGFLACGQLEDAERTAQNLTDQEGRDSLLNRVAETKRMRRQKQQEEAALAAYLKARALVSLGTCSQQAIDDLTPLTSKPIPWLSGQEVPPSLVLARAHRQCGQPEEAARYLRLARQQGLSEAGASAPSLSSRIEEIERWLERSQRWRIYQESHALLVSVSAYRHGWQPLEEPPKDVQAVSQALASHGFTIRTLEDPTREQLEEALEAFVAEHGGRPDNRLFFYFAGHGWTESRYGVELGYIVPVDATRPGDDPAYLQHLISMDQFFWYARDIAAKHALFAFDSCFSGTIFEATRSQVQARHGERSVEELVALPARVFITAGGAGDKVPDLSAFRRAMVRALEGEADGDGDGLVLGSEIGSFVRGTVAARTRTRPQWGKMRSDGFGSGDLLFEGGREANGTAQSRRQRRARRRALGEELRLWDSLRHQQETRPYREYLESHPEGVFAPVAKRILERLEPQAALSNGEPIFLDSG